MVMFCRGGVRCIAFGGLLTCMLSAYENTPAWARAFRLARLLDVTIKADYGYRGPLSQHVEASPPRYCAPDLLP
jgi:hypothetical protein